MTVSHGYRDLRPSIPVPNALFEASDRLRRADFGGLSLLQDAVPELKRFAEMLRQKRAKEHQLSQKDDIYYLWALCLQAEIYDYYGKYEAAEEVLKAEGRELEKKVGQDWLGATDIMPLSVSRSRLRQQLWTLIFYAHCHYRNERMEEAETLLDKIRTQVERDLPLGAENDEPSYGLRARIAYSLGQVYRQLSNVKAARKEFISAIEFTRKRLNAKTAKYSGTEMEDVRVREQKYANYVIAKAFSFGLCWASYYCGELQRARSAAAAGCTLLETTNDEVHKAYAQLLYAQTLSASARPVREKESVQGMLAEARSILAPLADDHTSPLRIVPRLLARAKYELARTLRWCGEYDQAKETATRLYHEQKQGSRWHLACGILLTRLLLDKGMAPEALDQTDLLLRLTDKRNGPRDLRAEACVCRADALMRMKSPPFDEILRMISEAEVLWREQPLSLAVCHLHRARCYGLQQNLPAAQYELDKWEAMRPTIEHGAVIDLAENVADEIFRKDTKFTESPESLDRGQFKGVENDLKVWAIRHLYARYGKDYLKNGNPERFLGKSAGTIRLWQVELDFDPTGAPTSNQRGSSATGSTP